MVAYQLSNIVRHLIQHHFLINFHVFREILKPRN